MRIYKKIILIILIFLLLVTSFFLITNIYAKYVTSVTGNTNIAISRWNIKVNGSSIKSNPDISNLITPIFPGNENIASNIIAPTAEGYFDLSFDFTDVDVSFKYTINVASDVSSPVIDLVTTGYSIDGGPKISFSNFNTPIEDTIKLSDNVKSRSVRVYLVWDDNPDTSKMNNIDDTNSTLKYNTPALLNVNIAFTQVSDQLPIV